MTGSSSDDWILLAPLITLNDSLPSSAFSPECWMLTDFTIQLWTLNSESQLNCTECFLPFLAYSPTVYRIASIRVTLQKLIRNVFNCLLLWKHVWFWLVVETSLANPLPSYSRTFRFQCSGFQAARHNIKMDRLIWLRIGTSGRLLWTQ
jgi:hypothetical protein